MDQHEVERLTVEAFVTASRRARWLADLDRGGDKRRKTVRLHDTRDFDPRWRTPVPQDQHTAAEVAALLRRHGATDEAWLMEMAETTSLPLEGALRTAIMTTEGLVICRPGTLAYLETETEGGFLLMRDGL